MSLAMNTVNWCDVHRINFPCDKSCPQCKQELEKRIEAYRNQPMLKLLSVQHQEGYDAACEDILCLLRK
jgi:hypothetical protein